MDGQPVWLASISCWNGEYPILTTTWSRTRFRKSEMTLRRLLVGAGNPLQERLFRMNLTLCMHRALTTPEVDGLPEVWKSSRPIHLAGGPIEILRETVEGALSTRPCVAPRMEPALPGSPVLLPMDCGACPPCGGRAVIEP